MKAFYDLILGLCCFKSVDQTMGLVCSSNRIRGDILLAITTVIPEDTSKLKEQVKSLCRHDVLINQSKVDNRYFCQNWGFIYCYNEGIHAAFWGTMDDDIEFCGDGDLVEKLYEANRVGFSVLGFSSSSHPYGGYVGFGDIGKYKNLAFVDGHNMFSHYGDNISFGLCDQIGAGNTSYVEVEYTNRLKYYTGKPILAQVDRIFLRHLFRADPQINALRVPFQNRDTTNGENFYQRKFGFNIYPGDVANFSWLNVIERMNQYSLQDRLKQFCYGGIDMDWVRIYRTYEKEFTHVYP